MARGEGPAARPAHPPEEEKINESESMMKPAQAAETPLPIGSSEVSVYAAPVSSFIHKIPTIITLKSHVVHPAPAVL